MTRLILPTPFRRKQALPSGYVKFTLPSAGAGTLYYGYTSASSYTSLVSAATRYYRSGSPYLSKITFVPYNNYVGTVSIAYAGYDASGNTMKGTVSVTVRDSTAGQVQYETQKNTPITFNGDDFGDAFLSATGSSLSYVKFSLPSASAGKLYYNYASSSSTGTAISATAKYYRNSSPYIEKVTFVPAAGYSGTAILVYTAYTSSGSDLYRRAYNQGRRFHAVCRYRLRLFLGLGRDFLFI